MVLPSRERWIVLQCDIACGIHTPSSAVVIDNDCCGGSTAASSKAGFRWLDHQFDARVAAPPTTANVVVKTRADLLYGIASVDSAA